MTGRNSRDTDSPDVVVIGGAAVGLACAWALRRTGLHVAVVDPHEPRASATWAAGGMLAPLGEAPEPGPFLHLALASLALYPGFVADLEAASNLPVPLHLNGKLLTATTPDAAAALERRRAWLAEEGQTVRWLDGTDVRELEPALDPAVEAGLLLEGNGRVDNRALLTALAEASRREGVRHVSGRARRLTVAGGRVEGVELGDGRRLAAPWTLVAAGAWAGRLEGLPREVPVRPVKGQMLALRAADRPLHRVVTSPEAYLIPRETERGPVVVVGATSEEAGFDRDVDEAGQAALAAGARALVPSLRDAPVTERWAGLRPGTPDDLPIVGPDPDLAGLWYATGHYRNGILLAPETARMVAAGVSRGAEPPSAFRPGRFPPTGGSSRPGPG